MQILTQELQLADMPADLIGALGASAPTDAPSISRAASVEDKKKGGKKKKSGPAPVSKLSLTGNRLEYLPAFVGELSSLRKLDIDPTLVEPPLHLRQEGIPIMQLYLRRFVTAKAQLNLDLRGMMLKDVKLNYYKLTSLTSCDLGFNSLTSIPDEVFKYTDLSSLALRMLTYADVCRLTYADVCRYTDLSSRDLPMLTYADVC